MNEQLLQDVIEEVRTAGKLFTTCVLDARVKGCPADFITAVDTAVHDRLTHTLTAILPGSAVLSEEGEPTDAERLWVLDPVDGTLNLVHGYGRAVIALGLREAGTTILGIVYDPQTDECFSATKGGGAFLNDLPITVSSNLPCNWLVGMGTSLYYEKVWDRVFGAARRVFQTCADFRRCGSAAMELCLIACGRQDAYFEIGLQPWDYTGAQLILEEAGGCVTDWEGNSPSGQCTLAASNSCEHAWFLGTLNG